MQRTQRILGALLCLLLLLNACTTQEPVGQTTPTPAANPTVVDITAEPAPPTAEPAQPTITPMPPPSGPIGAVEPITATIPTTFQGIESDTFASYILPAVQTTGQVQADPIAADLSNVSLSVILSPEQRERIATNGFAVSPSDTKEFYEIYERARYDYVPIFVTSDSLLHVYHLLFDKALRRAETESFIPMLARLDWELLNTSVAQYEELQGTPWADAARRNAAYFAVAVKLLDPAWPVPEGLRDLVEPELASIDAHHGLGPSAIFPALPYGEDWSQYVPRGHYTKSPALERYFRAMMWHGRMTMRANDANETRQAALLTHAFLNTTVDGKSAEVVWQGIYEPTVFFVGRSDDLTPQEYETALDSTYGRIASVTDLLDDAKFATFQQMAGDLRAPEILGMVINDQQDEEETTKGLRFMGQRFVPDAFVFRQLIHRNVENRMLPKALDFFAALGSDRALSHLESIGDTTMPNYTQNMEKLRDTFNAYNNDVWTQNLYWSWIHSLRPLIAPVGEGYPQFMRSEAWLDKQLTTSLGSWTQLKRDTILYAKQVYAEMGAGALPPPAPEPPKGYVEPVPEFYARIRALTQMTIDGLDSRGLLPESDKAALIAMAETATQLQTIAEKQLRNEALSEDEYTFIRFYGGRIEQLTFAADDEGTYIEGGGGAVPMGGDELQAAVVADVATDPNGQVLEEGVGRIFEIYVVVPIEDQLVLTKGGVFSHYEFIQPLSDRLTDEAWQAMLDEGNAPPLAEWTNSFMVEQNAAVPLAQHIRDYTKQLIDARWNSNADIAANYLTGAAQSDLRATIDQQLAQEQFTGLTLVRLEFLSFDFQDADHAIVTTRTTWNETLWSGSPMFNDQGGTDATELNQRGPYTLNQTYTLERQNGEWKIATIVGQNEPPPWP